MTDTTSSTGGSNQQGSVGRLQYAQEQLDLLALLMTAVKVLFVGGALQPARQLCTLLAAPIAASAAQLHRTSIRNEAAYQGCIQQLLGEHWPAATLQQLPRLAEQPIYLLGDSHVLPGGCLQERGGAAAEGSDTQQHAAVVATRDPLSACISKCGAGILNSQVSFCAAVGT
jgi:hypothetical protein